MTAWPPRQQQPRQAHQTAWGVVLLLAGTVVTLGSAGFGTFMIVYVMNAPYTNEDYVPHFYFAIIFAGMMLVGLAAGAAAFATGVFLLRRGARRPGSGR